MSDQQKYSVDLPTLSGQIKEDLEEATTNWTKPGETGRRTYLGASVIGDKCKAALWFDFRWVTPPEQFSGRMKRLFDRGHLEEVRINQWLTLAGWHVIEHDPSTGKQWQFSGVDGHFGGSCDKQMTNPKYPELGRVLGEDKTHNYKSYSGLVKNGVAIDKPKHVAQMHIYGAFFQNHYALYFPVNKNDDDFDPQLIEVDVKEARRLVIKAEEIISSKVRPPRLSETPTLFECRYCKHVGACHSGNLAEKSCRSCVYATPQANAEWFCEVYKGVIPKEFMPTGCPDHYKQVSY